MFFKQIVAVIFSMWIPSAFSYADAPRQQGLIFACTPKFIQNHLHASMPIRCSLSNRSLNAFSFYAPNYVVFYSEYETGVEPLARRRWTLPRGIISRENQRITLLPGQTFLWEEDFERSKILEQTGRLVYVPILFLKTQPYLNSKETWIKGAAVTIDIQR